MAARFVVNVVMPLAFVCPVEAILESRVVLISKTALGVIALSVVASVAES